VGRFDPFRVLLLSMSSSVVCWNIGQSERDVGGVDGKVRIQCLKRSFRFEKRNLSWR
jgi:hypothetical protein